jgi:hypothetical protein
MRKTTLEGVSRRNTVWYIPIHDKRSSCNFLHVKARQCHYLVPVVSLSTMFLYHCIPNSHAITTILEQEHCLRDTVADAYGTICLVVIKNQNALSPHHMSRVQSLACNCVHHYIPKVYASCSMYQEKNLDEDKVVTIPHIWHLSFPFSRLMRLPNVPNAPCQ